MKVKFAGIGLEKKIQQVYCMKAPKIDIEEMKKWKQRNFEERMKFIDEYVEWLRKNKIREIKK
ncbi:MAG: hypothetical protein J4431_03010 [Candidatus Aenigmarchaeota archaeon]|nr:hypothetical protein [Candidatus Aenigmarchaeota archaeon]